MFLKYAKVFAVFISLLLSIPGASDALGGKDCASLLLEAQKFDSPTGVRELVERYLQTPKKKRVLGARKLLFLGVGEKDVYNISAEFDTQINGKSVRVLLGRVEPRENHQSEVWFFIKAKNGVYEPLAGAPKFTMEDPFFTFIDGELVMGGVETQPIPGTDRLGYRTVFYKDGGEGVNALKAFAFGPWGMKDIRLKQLNDGRIFVATRPQGEIGGRGKVGVTMISSLAELNEEKILQAEVIPGQVPPEQWLGSNEIFILEDDIGFLSHVAYYKDEGSGERGYYVVTFTLKNPEPKIILIREDLPDGLKGESKRKDLRDVLFSGGMILHDDGTATLYVGAGDAEAYLVRIPNPFLGL